MRCLYSNRWTSRTSEARYCGYGKEYEKLFDN